MRIASFNVNSVRARMPRLLEWLAEDQPDVVALQEVKVEDDKFPLDELRALGYTVATHGQKMRHGVALLSRQPMTEVHAGYIDGWPSDCRVIRADIQGVRIVNTYVPNGTEVGTEKWDYKLRWLDEFPTYLSSVGSPTDPIVWLGDINVAPADIDVYDHKRLLGQVGHHPEEFARLAKIVDWGFQEQLKRFHPEEDVFTFWDYRIPKSYERNLGWRIDHVYLTQPLIARARDCFVASVTRSREKASDHTPVVFDLDD